MPLQALNAEDVNTFLHFCSTSGHHTVTVSVVIFGHCAAVAFLLSFRHCMTAVSSSVFRHRTAAASALHFPVYGLWFCHATGMIIWSAAGTAHLITFHEQILSV